MKWLHSVSKKVMTFFIIINLTNLPQKVSYTYPRLESRGNSIECLRHSSVFGLGAVFIQFDFWNSSTHTLSPHLSRSHCLAVSRFYLFTSINRPMIKSFLVFAALIDSSPL